MTKRHVSVKSILLIVTIVAVVLSNLVWSYIYFKEKNNLRHSLIPLTSGDYFQARLSLLDSFSDFEKEKYESNLNNIDEYYPSIKTNVPFISQLPNYPNGCEATSAVMLLRYYGIDISLDEFVLKYLKKDNIYSKDGERFGPDPKTTYAGNPGSLTGGFGIFAPGIRDAMEKALAEKMDSSSTERLYVFGNDDTSYPLEYYKLSFPIVIWATTNYEPTKEMWTWKSVDGTHSYTYPKNSHTIVVTGFDENYYYVNDPLQSSENTKIEKEKLEKSFDSLGRQVVGIMKYDVCEYDKVEKW